MFQSFLIRTYSFFRKQGALNSRLAKLLFWHSYRLYKKFVEDDLHFLATSYPFLIQGGDIFDVGANIGYTSQVLHQFKDSDGKLYAFEPEPWNFRILKENLNHFSNVELIQKAVGDQNKKTYLWVNQGHHADHRILENAENENTTITIEMITLDEFIESKQITTSVSFIKIDVQGYELNVCHGMKNIIDRNPNIAVFLEIVTGGDSPDAKAIFSFFEERGFNSYFLKNSKLIQIRESEILERAGTKGYIDILFTRQKL